MGAVQRLDILHNGMHWKHDQACSLQTQMLNITLSPMRTSLLTICATLVAIFTLSTVMTQADHHEESKKVLRHVVCFKFKESATDKQLDGIVKAFAALQKKIPSIKEFEWGTNNSPEKHDKGFTHCFILSFDSEKGRAAYLPHEDHKAFGAMLGPVLDDVFVIDYWAKK